MWTRPLPELLALCHLALEKLNEQPFDSCALSDERVPMTAETSWLGGAPLIHIA